MTFGFGMGFPRSASAAGGPSLSLQFAGSTTLDPQVTFTRASSGTYFDRTGTLQSAGNNVARFDYNPSTLAAQGLLIEEQRTNSIRNNTMAGAVSGTPGTLPNFWGAAIETGLTRTIVATGTLANGIPYIDINLAGTTLTTSLAFQLPLESVATQIAATTGQTWDASAYLAFVGTATGISYTKLVVSENNSGGTNLLYNQSPNLSVTTSLTRFDYAATLSQATTAFITPQIWIGHPGIGTTVNVTLRIGLPQLEQGAFATSVILTTSAAATRSADNAAVNTLTPWYNATAGTLYAQGTLVGGTAATFPYATALVGATPNNDSIGILWTANAGVMRFAVRVGAVSQADIGAGPNKSANSAFKVAGAYAANDFQAAFDTVLGTADTSGTLPTITALSLGGAVNFQPVASVWLSRVTYYPRRLSNAELQTITT